MGINICLKIIGKCSIFNVKSGDIQQDFHITQLTNKHITNKNITFLFHTLDLSFFFKYTVFKIKNRGLCNIINMLINRK